MVRLRAQALLKSGKAAEANKLLEDGVAKQPKSREFVVGLADLYADQKRTDDALRLLEQARKAFGDDQALTMRIANVYEGGGRLDEAEKELRKLMAEDPLECRCDEFAQLHARRARRAAAARRSISPSARSKVEPGNPAYLDTLGWALFKQGKHRGSGRAARQGRRHADRQLGDPGSSRRRPRQARTHRRSGRRLAARACRRRRIDRSRRDRKEDQGCQSEEVMSGVNPPEGGHQRWCPALAGLAGGRCCFPPAPRELLRVPSAHPTPDPTAADAFATATAACKGFRSIEGELSLSGRAGGERVRGRILTGLESGGAVRLEAVAPFGAPFFILAGRAERATLVLPREHRVLKDTAVADVLERLTGLALGADDLRLIVSGCLVERAAPTDGRQWGGGWRAVTIGPDRVAYLRVVNGQPVLTAADYGPWHVDYSAHAGGFPRVVRVRRAGAVAKADASTSPRASSS